MVSLNPSCIIIIPVYKPEMNSDEELADYLQVEDINRIPLPANPPYLTTTGVMFCYTQYEIAPYAAGIISFEIPYDQILPFLTDEAKALSEKLAAETTTDDDGKVEEQTEDIPHVVEKAAEPEVKEESPKRKGRPRKQKK